MKKKLTFMQPITRVHNIFRIRTVINHVTKFNQKNKMPSDLEIGIVLAQTGLSKYRKQKIKDRIMRRARDHLLTAAYMGLLTRAGRPLKYKSTSSGMILSKYGPNEECPKDSLEEAVFIDKIMRLKLTNVYDMQTKRQYLHLRSRPVLYLLYVLSHSKYLHEHQIAVAAGGHRCDPITIDTPTRTMLNSVLSYRSSTSKSLNTFYSDFGIDQTDKKNMTRNIRPLLDWCEAVGLVKARQTENMIGRYYALTERGLKIKNFYSKLTPIWFNDLGVANVVKAAALLVYQYLFWKGASLDQSLLRVNFQAGLASLNFSDVVTELYETLGLRFSNDLTQLETPVDFTLEYDVPPEYRGEVRSYLTLFCKRSGLQVSDVISYSETGIIHKLASSFREEHLAVRASVTNSFSKSTALKKDPIMSKVAEIVPSVGILSQYRSDFEKEVALLLRLLDLNAIKYQGQLADRCTKKHVLSFFENNPDILIINHIESLVECKSIGEWRSPLSVEKSVAKEIITYQQFISEVKPNSVVVIYEGNLDTDSYGHVKGILEDAQDVVFVTKNYLVNCVHQHSLKERFLKVIRRPREYDADSRILTR